MKVIHARNVNDAFFYGMQLIQQDGIREKSRAGDVLVVPFPVTTVYERPQERVLFSAARDANPIFHLMEALWLIGGRQDAKWLDQFVHDFSSRFAEDDGRLHGSYGYRWRHHFDVDGGGSLDRLPDQLNTVVELLKKNPQDRQAVLTMWDPVSDLGVPGLKDRPCNTHAYLRVRKSDNSGTFEGHPEWQHGPQDDHYVLDITVCCRSNDIIWGAYGSNVVQFSVLQEYLAARIGVGVGRYYQVSNNFHAYVDVFEKMAKDGVRLGSGDYPAEAIPLVSHPDRFDADLRKFLNNSFVLSHNYQNYFFDSIAQPMAMANRLRKIKDWVGVEVCLKAMTPTSDWKMATEQWLLRRKLKEKA